MSNLSRSTTVALLATCFASGFARADSSPADSQERDAGSARLCVLLATPPTQATQAEIASLRKTLKQIGGAVPCDDPDVAEIAQVAPEVRARAGYSAELCISRKNKSNAEANIAKEKKLAKKYGSLNANAINGFKNLIGVMDSVIQASQAALKVRGGPVACDSPQVADLISCFWREYEGGYCAQEAMERCEFSSISTPVTTCVW